MHRQLKLVTMVMLSLAAVALTAQQQSQTLPQWQIVAGGKMAFDVASVKQNKSGFPGDPLYTNFDLGPTDAFTPTGGLFRATHLTLLGSYIPFAYKLTNNLIQVLLSQSQLPKWVNEDRFDIEARAGAKTTKDQMRLMMQALLADRFKLAVHFETRELPVYALVLAKSGKTGPLLRPYPDGVPCSSTPPPDGGRGGAGPAINLVLGEFPANCGDHGGIPWPMAAKAPGLLHMGARNVTMEMIMNNLAHWGGLEGSEGRPLINQTGLDGRFDFAIEFAPEPSTGTDPQTDLPGPTFKDALQDQLGLKMVSTTAPVDVLVIDHVEEPTPN